MGIQLARKAFGSILGGGRINFPSVHEARWITDQTIYSPDYGWLEQFEFQLLFCGDDTKLNHSHHCLLSDNSAFVGNAFTVNRFNYWYSDIGEDRIPIPMMTEDRDHTVRYFPPPLQIQGQLFAVRPQAFLSLDTYKRNTVQFRRKRVNLILPYREVNRTDYFDEEQKIIRPLPPSLVGKAVESKERVYIIRAWMYVGKEDYWNGLLDAGYRGFKTVNYYESRRPWLKEYYAYPKREL